MNESRRFTPEKGHSTSRRDFLKTAIAASFSALVQKGDRQTPNPPENNPALKGVHPGTPRELTEKNWQPKIYPTGKLAGRKFGDLFSEYTGIRGVVPENAQIDFEFLLQEMWEKKEQLSGHNKETVATGRNLRREYQENQNEPINLDSYINRVNAVIVEVRNKLDYKALQTAKHLDEKQLALVKEICSSINGKDLMAYCLTELMPSTDGSLNAEVMDFLLRSGGSQYVERIPAVHDSKTSFGPYQFTDNAIYDTGIEQRGASIINRCLPKASQIPGSVAKLRGIDHHKAAFLFLMENVANLVHKINEKQRETLNQKKHRKEDLIAYIATAHHGPSVALHNAIHWLKNNAKRPYTDSCGHIYKQYAKKTEANLRALQ
jgi:hypothetical protein